MWSVLAVVAILLIGFVVMVYVIKVNDDLRELDARLDVLECELRYCKGLDNGRN